jgi:hypothetical protein
VGVKTAVIWWLPEVSALVVTLAVPAETGCELPMFEEPSLNWTLPAADVGVSDAAKTTGDPAGDGEAGVAARAIDVICTVPGLTVNASGDDVEPVNAAVSVGSNTAVMECEPADSTLVVRVACPLETACGVTRLAPASWNWTMPAADGVTEAVKVTGVAAMTGETGLAVTVVVVDAADGELTT